MAQNGACFFSVSIEGHDTNTVIELACAEHCVMRLPLSVLVCDEVAKPQPSYKDLRSRAVLEGREFNLKRPSNHR